MRTLCEREREERFFFHIYNNLRITLHHLAPFIAPSLFGSSSTYTQRVLVQWCNGYMATTAKGA